MDFKIDTKLLEEFDSYPKGLNHKDSKKKLQVSEKILLCILDYLIKEVKVYPSRKAVRKILGKRTAILGYLEPYSDFLSKNYRSTLIENNLSPSRGITDDSLFKDKTLIYRTDVEQKLHYNKEDGVFFVSSIIPGFQVDNKFMKSIETFCKHKKAKLILLPMKGLNKYSAWDLSDWNALSENVYTTYQFNSELKAFDILLHPNQINPLTGLDRFGQKDFSLIVASPKQQMKSVAVSTNKPPHILMTTGTICVNDDYTNNRSGRLALQDHILGGLIVEVKGNVFHIRQVQAEEDGSFIDLNNYYSKTGVKKSSPPKLYCGDSHAGWEDETAVKAIFEQIEFLNISEIFIGDLFDGTSISHHHIHDMKAQVNRPHNLYSLENELHTVAKYLTKFIERFPKLKINIVRSNHDEHLDKYLKEGRYTSDRLNHRLALDLAIYLLEDKNPIEEWIKKNYTSLVKNLKWLKRTDSYKVKHVELACHGDKGSDGKWASAINLEASYGSCVVGHHHTPQILRGVWIVGTNTKLQLPYTEGSPSSWLHANCAIYESGQRQMLISVNGKWKL